MACLQCHREIGVAASSSVSPSARSASRCVSASAIGCPSRSRFFSQSFAIGERRSRIPVGLFPRTFNRALRPPSASCVGRDSSLFSSIRVSDQVDSHRLRHHTGDIGFLRVHPEGSCCRANPAVIAGPCPSALCRVAPSNGLDTECCPSTNQERSRWARPNPSLQRTRYARR